MFTLLLVTPLNIRLTLERVDYWIILLLLTCIFPYIWGAQYVGIKTLNHLLAFITSIFFFYVVTRALIYANLSGKNGLYFIFKALYFSALLASIYILCEFYIVNILRDKSLLLGHVTREEYDATITWGIQRTRGFSSESGHMSLLYDLAIFPSLLVCSREKGKYWIGGILIFAAWISLFSAASFVFVGLAAAYLFFGRFRFSAERVGAVFLMVMLVWVAGYFAGDWIVEYVEVSLSAKLSILSSQVASGSAQTRLEAFSEAIRLLEAFPFGIGFGVAATIGPEGIEYFGETVSPSHLSMLALFSVAGGFPAAVLFVKVTVQALLATKRAYQYNRILFAQGLAIFGHCFVVGNFWLPYFWFYLAMVVAVSKFSAVSGRRSTEEPHVPST
jgi:hypothetical protein